MYGRTFQILKYIILYKTYKRSDQRGATCPYHLFAHQGCPPRPPQTHRTRLSLATNTPHRCIVQEAMGEACTYYSDIKVCDQSTTGIKGKSPMLFASCYYNCYSHNAPCPHVLPPAILIMYAILQTGWIIPKSARQHVPDQSGRLSRKFIRRFITLSTISSLGLGADQCRRCCRDLHSSLL